MFHRYLASVVVGGVFMGLVPLTCWSAEVVQPPTAALLVETHQILVAVVEAIRPAEEVHWKRVEAIQGMPPEFFSTKLEAGQSERVMRGREYLVAITNYRRHSLFREGLELDPGGPKVVEVSGLGPAIFPNLAGLRRLLAFARDGVTDSAGYVGELNRLMGSQASEVRRLALTEIYLRPEVLSQADLGTVASMRSILADSTTEWAESDLILTIGLNLALPLQGEWLLEESRRVLTEAPERLDLASSRPALVETALKVLMTRGTSVDGRLAVRHLVSNSPGVVRQGVATVGVLDCSAGLDQAKAILGESTDMHLQSRQTLEEFVGRGCDVE